MKNGWRGSTNNLPACYLTGLLLGKKSVASGTKNAVLYIGKSPFTSRVAACLKGVTDAGLEIPVSEDSLPGDDRITGQHIASYAEALKADEGKYNARFSGLLKNGLKPEDYPAHFEEIKSKIGGIMPKKEQREEVIEAEEGEAERVTAAPDAEEGPSKKPKGGTAGAKPRKEKDSGAGAKKKAKPSKGKSESKKKVGSESKKGSKKK